MVDEPAFVPTREGLRSDEETVSMPVIQSVPRQIHLRADDIKVNPWVHFLAGGVAGMVGSVVTSPLDVIKTRLQSDIGVKLHKTHARRAGVLARAFQPFSDTVAIMLQIKKKEGFKALFRGLGPNLAGVVPARSVNFFTYGLGKDFLAKHFTSGADKSPAWVHLLAGINAGIITSTVTNPIWLIKTRLQLDEQRGQKRAYRNSLDCLVKTVRAEGVRALYRGISASYLGTLESSLQWVIYEQIKLVVAQRKQRLEATGHTRTATDKLFDWFARSGAAGVAKFMASLLTYPHEVVRTRLRQAPTDGGKPRYTGLVQCTKLIVKEGGFWSLYSGLTPHLLRTVPNSIIMFGTWDLIIRGVSQ